MNKTVLLITSVIVWLAAGAALYATHAAVTEQLESLAPSVPAGDLYIAVLVVLGLAGLYLNTVVIDWITGESRPGTKPNAAQERAKALKEAATEEKAGNFKLAITILENAGLLTQAIEMAQNHGEDGALARLFLRIGKRDRAKKLYIQSGDFLAAAHIAGSLGELKEARENYAEAAIRLKTRLPVGEIAGLHDRARQREQAAALYEEAGDYTNAAECLELSGQGEKARVVSERAETIRIYEQKNSPKQSGTQKKMISLQSARALEELGDYFGAAQVFRGASEWKEAARCFEKFEEWERAASCYIKADQTYKAAEMKARAIAEGGPSAAPAPQPTPPAAAPPPAGPKEAAWNPWKNSRPSNPKLPLPAAAPAGPPPMPADPRTLGPFQFLPIHGQQIQLVPIAVPAGYLATPAAAMAGQTPAAWVQVAQQMAQGGMHIQAADLNLQIGKVQEAVQCLTQARRPLEAAMLSMGSGDYAQAAELLVKELEQRHDPEVGVLLGEMLVHLKEIDLAYRLLRTRLAREINRDNSSLVFQFAELFEEAGVLDKAAELYRDLIQSGAQSDQLTERLRSVEKKLQSGPVQRPSEAAHGTGENGPPLPPRTPMDFIDSLLEDRPATPVPTQSEAPTATTTPLAGTTRPAYPFVAKRMHRRLKGLTPVPARDSSETEAFRQVSMLSAVPPEKATTAAPDDFFAPGNRYELKKELGRGGMGIVYEAVDTALGRRVALKLVNSFDAGADNLKQFLVEGRAIARLSHPNVITVYDIGMMDLRHYIAMEFVDGVDLKTLISEKKRLSVKEALRLFIEVASGLKAAHAAGIIHRDIKPANVLLTGQQSAKLVDFGLAKLAHTEHDDAARTIFRTAGTPGYMAPEQIRAEELLPACDIYSLGITLFVMLVGDTPHRLMNCRSREEIVQFQLAGELPTIGRFREEIPNAIEHIYRYCTAARPESRYQRIDDFLPVAKQWFDAV